MNDTTKITLQLSANGPGLEICARLDGQIFWQGDPQGERELEIELSDQGADHILEFVLSGKTQSHTVISDDGSIIEDVTVSISNIKFDEIQIDQIMQEKSTYKHNFNGTKEPIDDRFFGVMGCNGSLSLKFSTPVYLWLLEHM